jgi:hypothetical protein
MLNINKFEIYSELTCLLECKSPLIKMVMGCRTLVESFYHPLQGIVAFFDCEMPGNQRTP